MTYQSFLKVVLSLQKQSRVLDKLYEQKVDLYDFADPYNAIIQELIFEIYGEQGLDWFTWFCYENDFGQGTLEAWDENKNRICYGHESLWEYLEKHHSKEARLAQQDSNDQQPGEAVRKHSVA